MLKIGFIGCGNMGGALAVAAHMNIGEGEILLANRTKAKAEKLAETIGGVVCENDEIAREADFIMLGVKPHLMADMLAGIADELANRSRPFVLVSMAAGLTAEKIAEMAGNKDYPVIRIMPNTPCGIGEGIVLYCANKTLANGDKDIFLKTFAGAGLLSPLDESLMDAGTALAGCGPAFVDLFIESLADGGVACGLPRGQAMELACQMIIGSAKLVLEKQSHPGAEKDAVCSPAGSTIQGVRALEKGGFRSAVIEAEIACFEKMRK